MGADGEGGGGVISFTVYGSPRPAGSKRAFVRGGRAMVVDANPAAKPWKQAVTEAALVELGNPQWTGGDGPSGLPLFPDGAVVLRMRFVLKRPKSHYRANGELKPDAPHFHTSRPDALKLARAVEDALSGVVYRDDAQTLVVAWKVYGEVEGVEVECSRPSDARAWLR